MSKDTVRSDRGPRKRRASNDDELESTRTTVQTIEAVTKAFITVIGQVKEAMKIAVPDILHKSTEAELQISLKKFVEQLPILGKLSESDQRHLITYGSRAFVVSFYPFHMNNVYKITF